jgi:hypothetical protein
MNKYSGLENLVELLTKQNKSLLIALIVLIILNIGVEVFRFISMLVLARKEKKSKKDLLKEDKRLKILEQLFQSLDKLSLFDREDSEAMLVEVKSINNFISKNKLYIPPKFQEISNDILDYFKNVMTDYRQKDIEKESKLFEKYFNEFNR